MRKYFSPGRVNLIGEHIDYNGGNVFPAAIHLGTYGEVTLRDDRMISLYSKNFPDVHVPAFSIDQPLSKDNQWSDYVKAVLHTFNQAGFVNQQGFDLVINGDIPNSSGLSSSASIEVLIAVIIKDLNNFQVSDQEIALLCQKAENEFIGVNCGIMDEFIIANGIKNKALNLNCATLEYEAIPFVLKEHTLLVLNTKKKRGLVDSAYNERRQQCEAGLKIVQKTFDVKDLCAISPEQLASIKDQFTPVIYQRVLHAVTEQARVNSSMQALQHNDIAKFCELLNASHLSLKNDYEVSCKELDCIVDLARKYGAQGARMTGAGFGGCAIALVPNQYLENFNEQVLRDYQAQTGLKGEIYSVFVSDKAGRYE